MKTLAATFIAVTLLFSANAVQAKPTYRIATATGFTIALPEGKAELKPLPLVLGFAVVVPMSERWSWMVQPGVKTGLTAFNPAPQLVVGPNLKLTDKLTLSFSLLYRYTPDYAAKGDNHMVAALVAVIVAVTPEVSLGLGFGGDVVISGSTVVPEVALVPLASFKLP